MQRFDDLIRSERYYTATLFPAMLFHNDMEGVKSFVNFVGSKAETERNRLGQPIKRDNPPYDFENLEVITEFHIARDLKFSGLLLPPPADPADLTEQDVPKKDAPDIVIVAGQEMMVCEGKFFSGFNTKELNEQLESQRRQVQHLFDIRHDLRAYCHIAILPEKPTGGINADAVITWDEVLDLTKIVMGSDHYVTRRLCSALKLYREGGMLGVQNYDGALNFSDMRAKCRECGKKIQVGHSGGELALLTMTLPNAEQKKWRWRDPDKNEGRVIPGNWLRGDRWLEIVESGRGFGSKL